MFEACRGWPWCVWCVQLQLVLCPLPPLIHGDPKKRRHLTLTDTAVAHLCDIAHEARLSKSETVERLIRSTPIWEGASFLNDEA